MRHLGYPQFGRSKYAWMGQELWGDIVGRVQQRYCSRPGARAAPANRLSSRSQSAGASPLLAVRRLRLHAAMKRHKKEQREEATKAALKLAEQARREHGPVTKKS